MELTLSYFPLSRCVTSSKCDYFLFFLEFSFFCERNGNGWWKPYLRKYKTLDNLTQLNTKYSSTSTNYSLNVAHSCPKMYISQMAEPGPDSRGRAAWTDTKLHAAASFMSTMSRYKGAATIGGHRCGLYRNYKGQVPTCRPWAGTKVQPL